ncbi:UvrB/UvrC motif-containing protein [Planctomycetaceae bacterium]|jgi:protein arginine kinase activator|nr:UvrB/UvrC motif-containing protein [Planctomycetaceae bacterium]
MKKCRRCSKPATLHITEMREGEVHELHLCETCYQEYLDYSETPEEPPTTDSAPPEIAIELTGDQTLEELDQTACPNCGISFREFRSQGRLGCPHDYTEFENELLPLLENIHGETQHCGKLPTRAADSSRRQYELIRLRKELQLAVAAEDYETAAQLRDTIVSLESDLGLNDNPTPD